MKIGLYFGSFNPIHTGHLIIASYVQQNTQLDQVWFIVSPQNPLKTSAGLLNEYHRLYLVQIALEGEEQRLKASDIEFRLPKPSFTVTTMAYLHEKYPEHIFSILLGSDGFQNINRWKNYTHLLENYEFYIYPRPGHEIKEKMSGKRIHTVSAPLLDISATRIRELIKNGRSIRFLVPDKVKEEIEANNYYKQTNN
ncbi:MAG TPA: nicotinate (nicotinamide) nucleotide adenylyltransferase [Flavitalea sp.]|nr:nicotinate (nicotinamide) nucleotide adenylyltransferase [Flavitalea sp.]